MTFWFMLTEKAVCVHACIRVLTGCGVMLLRVPLLSNRVRTPEERLLGGNVCRQNSRKYHHLPCIRKFHNDYCIGSITQSDGASQASGHTLSVTVWTHFLAVPLLCSAEISQNAQTALYS